MPVPRRTVMTVLGGIVLGYGSATAVGAFDRVELDRDITIDVDADHSGLLRLTPAPSRTMAEEGPTVDHDETGRLYVEITGETINPDSETYFDELLRVKNEGSQDVELSIELLKDGSTPSDKATIYPSDDREGTIGVLAPDDIIDLGLHLEAADGAELEAIDTMRFTTESA